MLLLHLDATSSGFGLPAELLVLVLQQLDLADRFFRAASVSHNWHTAAAAATSSVCKTIANRAESDSFQLWLERRGRHVLELQISAKALCICLPCCTLTQLRSLFVRALQLKYAPHVPLESDSRNTAPGTSNAVQPAAASGCSVAVQSLALLTSLTRLSLNSTRICSCSGGMCCISALSGLKRLELFMVPVGGDDDTAGQVSADFGAALQHLQQLTHLELVDTRLGDVALAGISNLHSLQHLELVSNARMTADAYARLPATLTALTISPSPIADFSSSSFPGFNHLTALQHLTFYKVRGADLSVLSHMMQLTRLHYMPGQYGHQAMATLLAVLPQLQQLQELRVCCGSHGDMEEQAPGTAHTAQQWSALCCSSALTWLALDMPGPAVAQQLFPAWRQLPALQHLSFTHRSGAAAGIQPPLGPDAVNALATCCPGLQQLDIMLAVQPRVQLTPLGRLSALTHLVVGGEAISDAVAEQGLAQLTGLQKLVVEQSRGFTDAGEQALPEARKQCFPSRCIRADGGHRVHAKCSGTLLDVLVEHSVVVATIFC